MRSSLLAVLALASALPARADWLLDARQTAASAPVPGAAPPERPKSGWTAYEAPSRLFRGEIPSEGWTAFEEEDAQGDVVRLFGPDDPSGALRAVMSVRLVDRDAPGFLPAKEAVEAMRKPGPDRDPTPVLPLRIAAGLARIFEVVETRRLPLDEGPSAPMVLHQYVAVIPRGDSYYLIRLTTSRASYLDFRSDFVRFLKAFRPVGVR